MAGTRGSAPAPRPGPPEEPEGEEPNGLALCWPTVAAAALVLAIALAGWTQTDLDSDGTDAWTELSADTSPWNPDTDADGLDDGFELDRRLDPVSRDTDGDGVEDRTELVERTDPRSTDSDGDGLDDGAELQRGTDPRISDTDGDEVSDADEVAIGTDPLDWDTDGDGLDDAVELLRGASPWATDTDADGLDDLEEAREEAQDCDGDGVGGIAEADDDADHLLDVDEEPDWLCQQDTDGDEIDDGLEAARPCVTAPDCDGDGLLDREEMGSEFDRLDPDTFDAGLLDGVTDVFQRSGQAPSSDGDGDGIPDAWESSEGLLEWTRFDPEPGRRDLLVEFVRVEGPDSGPLGPGEMTDVYDRVAGFFEGEGDVALSWFETTVRFEEEKRPPVLPSSNDAYYREVLSRARASGNPYVTTVVMNPQHDQSQTTHQGVAPIRGMLAAVDYGAHTRIHFESDVSSFTISPLVESFIVAGRADLIGTRDITGGGREADGDMFLTGEDWRLTWGPFWFRDPPVQRFDDGTTMPFRRSDTALDEDELADTVAHEIGHTLGLCHLTLPDYLVNLTAADRDEVGVSTMDPRREGPRLEFLDSEWDRLRGYLSCPPQRSVGMVAEGADRARVIDAKYAVTLENVLDVGSRQCQDLDPIPADLTPTFDAARYVPSYTFTSSDLDEPATVYRAQAADRVPAGPQGSPLATVLYALASLTLAAGAGGGLWRWQRREA